MPKIHCCPTKLLHTDLTGKTYIVTGGNSANSLGGAVSRFFRFLK